MDPMMKIDPTMLKDIICECGCNVFVSMILLREVPFMYSKTGKNDEMSIQIGYACISCNKPRTTLPGVTFDAPKTLVGEDGKPIGDS